MAHNSPSGEDLIPRILYYPADSDRPVLRSRESSTTITPASPPIPLLSQPQGPSIEEVLYELEELISKWEHASESEDNSSLIQALEEYDFIFSISGRVRLP